MKTLRASLAAKIAAMAFVFISLVLLAAGFAGVIAMDAMGGYQMRKEEMMQKVYEEVCRRYSLAAMAEYIDEYDTGQLSQSNFRYGIVKAKNIELVDFSDPDRYIAGNFEQIPDTKQLHFEQFDLSDEHWFELGTGSILDFDYYYHNEAYTEMAYPIEGWFYDIESNTFYVRSQNALYPISNEEGALYTLEDGEQPLSKAKSYLLEQEGQNTYQYIWHDCTDISFYGASIWLDINEIEIVDGMEHALEDYGEIKKESPHYFEENTFYMRHKNKSDHYIVASYVNMPLAGEWSFENGDMFVQANILIDFAYRVRYTGIVILIIALLVLIASFSFLMASAGYRKGQEGVCMSFIDHMPLDIYFALISFVEMAVIYVFVLGVDRAVSWAGSGSSGIVTIAVMLICAGIVAVLLAIAFCMSFAVRVKIGKWWRSTFIYIVLKKCVRLLRRIVSFLVSLWIGLCRSITLLWKAWLILGFLAFAEFAAIQMSYADGSLTAFWIFEKLVLYPVLIIQLLHMNRLQKGAQQIANGNLDYQVDTNHMFGEIRLHGQYLNDIGCGINSAVNERMKSEHFKTELITNVSHDIKTPLTSIINYVDLLQKEEIENPTVQEYLEVLHRQSARLKKLIEDLMEASKASTGSLHVVMEKCDAGVMLVQTIGEFEEKLMQEQIELQIKKPEAEIMIEADHRHLWRVFDNLMNNICKYAQPSTRAYVNLEQRDQQAVITLRNISKYQLNISSEELMERFVRGDSSRNTEGSGLGISIAKSLTELMNGTFTLTVDGDLFKVVLSFPLYGSVKIRKDEHTPHADAPDSPKSGKKEAHLMEGLSNGIQTAGSYAAGFGQGVADKTGRIVRRAGKFAHHVRQAAAQAKAEEEAEQSARQAQTPHREEDIAHSKEQL